MEIVAEGRTDVGLVRTNNEDSFYIEDKEGLLIVADGMGGHASGEIASKLAVDVMRDYFKAAKAGRVAQIGEYREEYSKGTNMLSSSIRLANTAIYEAAGTNARWQGMGTTVAAVLVDRKRLSIAHVGDSRVYLIRAGEIEQLTDDHSVVYEQLKRDLVTKEEAEKSRMRNVLTRALGVASEVDVDVDELTLSAGDILVLCTDGLSGMVPDAEISSATASAGGAAEACDRLVAHANANGGKDNVTVVVGYVKNKSWVSFILNFMGWFRR